MNEIHEKTILVKNDGGAAAFFRVTTQDIHASVVRFFALAGTGIELYYQVNGGTQPNPANNTPVCLLTTTLPETIRDARDPNIRNRVLYLKHYWLNLPAAAKVAVIYQSDLP